MTFSSLHHYLIIATLLLSSTYFGNKISKNKAEDPSKENTTEEFCASHHLLEAALQKDKSLQKELDLLEKNWTQLYEQKESNRNRNSLMVTLPVVVHVIHNNGPENIADAEILESFDFLNNAFANENPYDTNTGVNTTIQFCLAQENPIGNPTTGINHVVSTLTDVTIETEDLLMKDVSRWDPTRYINIWVVKEICSTAAGCGVAGYAYFPSSHGDPEDGLVVESKWLGGTPGDASVLAHEMGHYLGLYHTFQGGCGNNDCLVDGDRVCDTPPDQSTVGPPCNIDVNSCSTDVNLSDLNNPFTTDQNDMFWNYMDYGEWDCYSAFTQGQADRMDFFINNVRFSLTGQSLCDNPCTNPMTLLVEQGDTIVNAGTTLTFLNNTIGATSFEWEVNGIPVSTSTNFSYTFSPEGTYNITLNAFNGDTLCDASLTITVIAFDCVGNAHVSDSNGTDLADCGTLGNPCKTIQYALDNVLCSGDTVFIHSDTYQLPAGTNSFTPIALIPENYAVTFLGVEDNGPVIIDGGGERRAFFYSYFGGGCPYDLANDGINVSNHFNFINLTIQNTHDTAVPCGTTNQTRGAALYLYNNAGSNLNIQIQNCIFKNNMIEDPIDLNNNGRSASGGAIYIHGLVSNQNTATTSAKVLIQDCDFSQNSAVQLDNGGHGGAVCLVNCDTALISNSFFCNNTTYSENSDNGDLNFDRNAGGAVMVFDNFSQSPGHYYQIDASTFIGNSATTANGASFAQQSEGGAVFMTSGDALVNNTSATLVIGNSHFYDNNIETGIEHIDNNSGTLDLTNIGNNVFSDSLDFSLGNDTTLCVGTPLFASYFPGATYEWSTGETTSSISVVSAGTYSVTVSLGQCSTMDAIFISTENCDADCEDTWFQTMGTASADEGSFGIIESGDGNFYVKGTQNDKVLLIKMEPDGNILWSKTMKFTNESVERLYDLTVDSEGFLVGCGTAGNTVINFKTFIFKYDANNDNLIWSKLLESGLITTSIIETSPTDDYLLSGQIISSPDSGFVHDTYMLSVNRNTGILSGTVNTSYDISTGARAIIFDVIVHQNAIYTCGSLNSDGIPDSRRGTISKIDFNGNMQWTRFNLQPLSASARLLAAAIIADQDSLVVGYQGNENGIGLPGNRIFLSKSDLDGNMGWSKAYDFTGFTGVDINEIAAVDDGYLLLISNVSLPIEIALLKLNKNGTVQWAKRFVNIDGSIHQEHSFADDQLLVANDRIYITGSIQDNGGGNDNILVVKTDLNGNINNSCPSVFDIDVGETTFSTFSQVVPITEYSTSPFIITNTQINADSTFVIPEKSCIGIGPCTEICDNGIDDDGDGLIDCFDPDCCADETCLTYYYNECDLDCFFSVSSTANIELEIEWESSDLSTEEWCSYNTPITGDLDGDGIPEVIGKPCPSVDVPASLPYPNLLIVDGASGLIENMIITPAFYYVMDAPAIADVDGNGYAEIFVHASDDGSNNNYTGGGPFITGDVQRRILCYEYDGTDYVERWMSDEQIGYNDDQQAIAVSVADFNGDGIPELHCGNQILNSLTGELIVEGGADNHNGSKNQGDDPSLSQAYAVAVDALPDDFCTNCTGLELVAGGMVYSVNIDPANPANNTMTVEVALPNAPDGWTSIADLDSDGDIDAVVSTSNDTTGVLYAWDIQTATALYDQYQTPPSQFGYISQANIADFDGDGFVEIGICSQFNYQVLKPEAGTFNLLWSIDTDDSSGSTGSSVFDFNNDGSDEVIYRTETELLVLNGATGTVASTLPCESGTRMEYPVVVDVDADGETELLCSCDGKLVAYGSASTPWIDTRSVWNQRNYFNVNIEDDLTVPTVPQQHHIVGDSVVMNNFLTMYGSLQSTLPDATAKIDTVICDGEEFELTLTICNNGDNTLTGETAITFYNSDPTNTSPDTLFTTTIGTNLLTDSCKSIVINITPLFEIPIYVVVNDDYSLAGPYDLEMDFPVTAIAECSYTNNIDSFLIADPEPPILDLGMDTLICHNGVLNLNAGSGFESYEWYDGSTDSTLTVFEPGEYWVEVTSICGVQRDTVEVEILMITDIMLPPSFVLCDEDCATLEVTDWFDSYQWIPSDYLDCDTCSTVVACPPVTTTYIVIGSSNLGCFSIDTVTITPIDPIYTVLDTAVCLGDVFEYNGVEIPIGGSEIFETPGQAGCSDTLEINVSWNGGDDAPTLVIDAFACENEVFIFDGVEIPPNTQETFNYQTYLGCDSVIIVAVAPLPIYEITLFETICQGDSALIFGTYQSQPGGYNMLFTSEDNCDSMVIILLNLHPFMNIAFDNPPICSGASDGIITATASGGSGGGYTYLWSTGETTSSIMNLSIGDYSLTVTDGNGCTIAGIASLLSLDVELDLSDQDADCFNAPTGSTGSIAVTNAEPGWMFSLNDGAFQSDSVFTGLAADEYTITVIDGNGCEVTEDFTINSPSEFSLNFEPDSINVFVDEEYTFMPDTLNPSNQTLTYSWTPSTGLSDPNILNPTVSSITDPATYILTVGILGNPGCFLTDSITVIPQIQCDGTYALPNAFTPDGDGVNDVFTLLHLDNGLRINSFHIYNRWGNKVFEADGDNAGWNGMYKGKPAPMDVYIYSMEILCPDGEEDRVLRGDVTLIR
ncbi:MAG: gliding motility-associated-like protein [Flavobacteriales bacterium]|jgi:gliding motility-associated-like protein